LNKIQGEVIMKNKFFIAILTLVLISTLVGCGGGEPSESTEEPNQEQDINPTEDQEEINEEEEPEEEEPEEESEEPINQETSIDSSLEGIDLLNSISDDRPDTMIMKMEMSSYGMTTVSTSYYDGDNTRTETVVEGMGKSVLIYNTDEEMMYSYVEGEGEGMRIIGADKGYAEEAGLTIDLTTKFSGIAEDVAGVNIVRVEKLGQEEVIYIETTEVDEEMGDMLVKMWYSVKYNIPLKYEIYMGQNLLMTLEAVEIEKDVKIDKNMFVAPSDINFQDVDMDAMMEMME